jgi:hypothetical protein
VELVPDYRERYERIKSEAGKQLLLLHKQSSNLEVSMALYGGHVGDSINPSSNQDAFGVFFGRE